MFGMTLDTDRANGKNGGGVIVFNVWKIEVINGNNNKILAESHPSKAV